MSDIYVRISDDSPKNTPPRLLIVGYVSLAALYTSIITYCILSPSLFSTLSLMFMLGNFAFTVGTPYYIMKTNESIHATRVYAYPIERSTCIMFIVGNLGAFIYKVTVFYTGVSDGYSMNTKQFLEVQGALNIFLPLTMLPLSILSSLIRTNSRDLDWFIAPINKLITVPIFLSMGVLILLIQIYSISLSGFLFFICMLVLFVQRKIDFSNFNSWLIVIAIQILCLIFIVANFLATSKFIGANQKKDRFEFYGINSLNDFKSSLTSRGYFICLCLLFVASCLVQRIFAYQNIWKFSSKIFNEQKSRSQMGQENGLEGSQRSTIRNSLMNEQAGLIRNQRKDSRYSLQQFQLPVVNEGSSLSSPRRNQSLLQQPNLSSSLNQKKAPLSKSILSQPQKSSSKQPILQKIVLIILTGINKFVDFIYSTQFSLRFTQVMSIIVIQRYNNIYSFVAVLWLTIVASTNRVKIIFYLTGFVLLPVEIGNFVIMYFYNAKESPIHHLTGLEQYGFQDMGKFWLDIIIFNVYLFYMITFLLSASKEKQAIQKPHKIPAPTVITIIIACFFRYSYLLTIGAMFFLGFSNVRLMNFVYLIMFLVFFSSGENILVETKMKNGKSIAKLTTFSRKYWYIIVYYTLVCVIAKYCYFLFFNGKLSEDLQPTGINQVYEWSFNFSLSSVCLSNTTPLFIIFILSQAQIMIYRSSIYLTYSFALVNHVIDKKNGHSKIRSWLNSAFQLFMEFYLQGLYYISGIVIIACSYRWNVLSLTIIMATCLGLMTKFNKIILSFIVFMDLSNIIINYFVLFTEYQVVKDMLGTNVYDVVLKISTFLGLLTKRNSGLASTFALNIVIFYFAVESYALKKILDQDRFNEDGDLNRTQSEQLKDDEDEDENVEVRDTLSAYQPTIIESQYDDSEFGKNFNKSVIIATKRMYGTVLWKKYGWWQKLCRVLSIFSTDLITIFVLISCLVFRLSVSMFYFLFCYMLYYFVLFDRIGLLMQGQEFYSRIEREFNNYKKKEAILCDRDKASSMIDGSESTQSVIAFIDQTRQKYLKLRFFWRNKLWMGSSIMAVLCLILTYTSQFVISQFYTNYIPIGFETNVELLDSLFILGISVTKQESLFRQIYFYYFMLIILVGEKLLLSFVRDVEKQEVKQVQPMLGRTQLEQILDASNFIDYSLNFIQSVEIKNEELLKEHMNNRLSEEQNSSDYSRESNLLIYFEYKKSLIQINYLYGILMVMLRLYLLMMLINLYQKSNVFAIFYLVAVLVFWFQPLQFSMVRHINKIAIVILLLQYIVLLLDINTNSSPLVLPMYDNLSLLDRYISDPSWRNYIVIDYDKTYSGSFIISFLISSIIIFLTQFYYTLFFKISLLSIQKIRGIYDRYEYITQNVCRMPLRDTIYLNYENYKDWGYRFMTLSYELLINNSYIFVSYLILILLSTIHTYISVGLVYFACVYIYLGVFTRFSQSQNIYQYTKNFFRVVQGILFVVLGLIIVSDVPVFNEENSVVVYIQGLSNLGQIFLLFFIQIWLDLSVSTQFKEATLEYNNKVRNRQNVMIKCIAYQENQDLIRRMLHRYKEAMWFEVNLKDALDIIDEWHKAMYKKKVPEFENLKVTKDSAHTMALKSDIKAEQQKRPQQDQQIVQILKRFMLMNTSVALRYRYYEIMKLIVFNNHRLLDISNCSIDIWDYVLENYERLNEQIGQAQGQIDRNIKIIQGEEIGDRMDRLQQIKLGGFSQDDGNINEVVMGIIKTPDKIFIDIKEGKDSTLKIVLFFVMSNFEYFLSFFTWVYYMINPCLLSLPFIVYFFSYEIISYYKLTSFMLVYIFSIIILAMCVQIQNIGLDYWVKYLFYQNGDYTAYALGYLLFIFILIFINQEIKKYQGNKFKYFYEAQNRMQGAFRMLLNEDKNSPYNLWNFKVEQDFEQKQINPMNYFSQKIQQKPEHLTQYPQPSFFESFNEGKTGVDLYPLIASVQIFLTIFLIFFYPFMVQSQISNFQDSFKYFQFSSNMVIGLLCHVFSIVIQRRITMISPQNPNKSKIKYFYTMFILALFLIFIYFIAPTSTQANGVYQPSGFLVAFSFFYFFYFFLSALQIRFGYKKYKSLNSMMTKRRQLNNLVLVVFTAVPFLYELKLMMDYSFVPTSLKIFDWFRLWSIYYSAFKAKMQYYSSTGVVLGDPQPWYAKIIGWGGFIGILIIIFGPMILFSGLNPIAQSNLVVGGALELGIQIQGGNYFTLYSTSHFSSPPYAYSYEQFKANNFSQVQALQFLTASDVPQQFQNVSFQPYSDQNWGISEPNFNTLIYLMNKTLTQMQNNTIPTNQFSIAVKYALDRRVSQTIATDTSFNYPSSGYLNQSLLQSIYTTFTTCNTSTYLPNFYISLIRLYTIGNSYKPRPIVVNSSGVDPYLEDVELNLLCSNTNSTNETNNVYWSLSVANSQQQNGGLFLNVLCDKYQNLIGGLGFTALYTSVILVVASFIRSAFEANLPQIPYYQNPKPDNIIQISEAIGTLRDRKQFREQYLMYYELIDIIRSPDLMKYLSGSFPALIEKADAKRRKKQKDEEMQNRKDKIQ